MALPGILGRLIGKRSLVERIEMPTEIKVARPHPLDHDGDGKKGGSKKKAKAAE